MVYWPRSSDFVNGLLSSRLAAPARGERILVISSGAQRNFLTIHLEENARVMQGLSSPVRLRILCLLHTGGPMNVNEISRALRLPQSTIATNVHVLEECKLIHTETIKAKKRQQKICSNRFDEEGFKPA
jgi:predicted transcriptional regulator